MPWGRLPVFLMADLLSHPVWQRGPGRINHWPNSARDRQYEKNHIACPIVARTRSVQAGRYSRPPIHKGVARVMIRSKASGGSPGTLTVTGALTGGGCRVPRMNCQGE